MDIVSRSGTGKLINKQLHLYSLFTLAKKFTRYFITAVNGKGHGIHSPFVFGFVKNVLNDGRQYPEYKIIEALRKKLVRDESTVSVLDLGAGSAVSSGPLRKISSIARNAAKPAKYGQLLFRIVKYYQPEQVLELGTSLGITTAYLASALRNAAIVTTIEGSPAIAEIAAKNLQSLSLERVNLLVGEFDDQLPEAMAKITGPCLVFIDGNHRKAPTLNYFRQLLPLMKAGSILIFDDIHWSGEMEEAWSEIQSHAQVLLTIDLFFIGIVFFQNGFLVKQHFTIRY